MLQQRSGEQPVGGELCELRGLRLASGGGCTEEPSLVWLGGGGGAEPFVTSFPNGDERDSERDIKETHGGDSICSSA